MACGTLSVCLSIVRASWKQPLCAARYGRVLPGVSLGATRRLMAFFTAAGQRMGAGQAGVCTRSRSRRPVLRPAVIVTIVRSWEGVPPPPCCPGAHPRSVSLARRLAASESARGRADGIELRYLVYMTEIRGPFIIM